MIDKGLLLIISGFSGTGKGTVVNKLLTDFDDSYAVSVSATTRDPREGERDGVDYFFKTTEEFELMIENDELIEHACYVKNYYGTPRKFVEDKLDEGKNVILEIEIQGALDVKRLYPDCVLIFLLPPDVPELERRLKGRGSESDSVVKERLYRAVVEVEFAYKYDYLVINDDLDKCCKEIDTIVSAEKLNTKRNTVFIDNIEKELKGTFA